MEMMLGYGAQVENVRSHGTQVMELYGVPHAGMAMCFSRNGIMEDVSLMRFWSVKCAAVAGTRAMEAYAAHAVTKALSISRSYEKVRHCSMHIYPALIVMPSGMRGMVLFLVPIVLLDR